MNHELQVDHILDEEKAKSDITRNNAIVLL